MTSLRRIIIAEDNNADEFLVRTALEEVGITAELHTFTDGEEVLRFLQKVEATQENTCPDLLILDLNLPRYSGEEILERLRQSPLCGKMPVIVITSSDSASDRDLAHRMGVAHYFRKPTDYDTFLQIGYIVKAVLDRHERDARSADPVARPG